MLKKIFKILLYLIAGFHVWILILTIINPIITPYQFFNLFKGYGIEKIWVDYEEINPQLFKCLITSEDSRYFEHHGVDWKAVEEAKKRNARYPKKRRVGASTITMQTCKNTFLWHGRNYIRKGLELYCSYIIDLTWGKKRVLEVYANVVEWDEGIYGIEAASKKYFKKSADKISLREASLLVAILPNPKKWNAAKPTNYILRRAATIRARSASIRLRFD